MIIQGSNVPLTIVFDQAVSGMDLVVTLWGANGRKDTMLKKWETADMSIADDTVVCPLTEAETAALPSCTLIVEAKGLADGETVFWQAAPVDVLHRRDRVIRLTEV